MIKHLSENISDKEERLLSGFLASDSQYKTRYKEMAKTRAVAFIPVLEEGKRDNYENLSFDADRKIKLVPNSGFFNYLFRIAAVILLLLSTSISLYYYYLYSEIAHDRLVVCQTVAPLGSKTKMILPDSTVVWLNSGSTLKYNNLYGKKNREVLLSGEGYFQVAKDEDRPFLVHTNHIEIAVLGTVFNVRSYSNEPSVEVNLLEGKVDVSIKNSKTTEKLSLRPNEKMIYDKSLKTMHRYETDAMRSALWVTGKLCFVDASLTEIAKDLERKYDVQIIIDTKKIKDEIFSGSLDLNQPVEKLLEYIDVDKKHKRTFIGRTIIIDN
jgi:hypothetical protein